MCRDAGQASLLVVEIVGRWVRVEDSLRINRVVNKFFKSLTFPAGSAASSKK